MFGQLLESWGVKCVKALQSVKQRHEKKIVSAWECIVRMAWLKGVVQ
jgi:hypothetical protein